MTLSIFADDKETTLELSVVGKNADESIHDPVTGQMWSPRNPSNTSSSAHRRELRGACPACGWTKSRRRCRARSMAAHRELKQRHPSVSAHLKYHSAAASCAGVESSEHRRVREPS
jgi:hypothetical protein